MKGTVLRSLEMLSLKPDFLPGMIAFDWEDEVLFSHVIIFLIFWNLKFFNIRSFYLRCVLFLTFFARPT